MPRDYQKRWPDHQVEHLILATDDFIVYLDGELDVDWATSKNYDEKGHHNRNDHLAILSE